MTRRSPLHAASTALLLLCLGLAHAAGAETLRIVLGSQRRVALPSDVQRVAVGDPGVTQVHMLTSRELLALGRSVGRTNVLLWTADGRVDELVVHVERDLSLLAEALRDIHPDIRVTAAPDRDAVVLRGRVPEARYASAAEGMALDYLGESLGRNRGELFVSADEGPDSANGGEDASDGGSRAEGGTEGNPLFLSGDPRRTDADVVNLIQIEGLPPSLEARIRAAIVPIGGAGIRVRRLVQGTIPSDANDAFVLEGEVRGQVELVRVLLAAARLVSGREVSEGSIDVLANEAGSLTSSNEAGEPGFQLASLGGFTGGTGVTSGSVGNDLASNVARAKALSVADGRILAFIDVADLPQIRLETRIYEFSRSKLRRWVPNLNVVFGDELDNFELLPSPTSLILQGEDAPVVTPTQVQAAASLLQGGAVAAGVQYVSDHVALDATLTMLEDASIARSLARPSITVLSGEVARFRAGGQIPIAVTVDTQTSAAADRLLSSTVFASFGVAVTVRAMVAEDDTITLDVHPVGLAAGLRADRGHQRGDRHGPDHDGLREPVAGHHHAAPRRPELRDRGLPAVLPLRRIHLHPGAPPGAGARLDGEEPAELRGRHGLRRRGQPFDRPRAHAPFRALGVSGPIGAAGRPSDESYPRGSRWNSHRVPGTIC